MAIAEREIVGQMKPSWGEPGDYVTVDKPARIKPDNPNRNQTVPTWTPEPGTNYVLTDPNRNHINEFGRELPPVPTRDYLMKEKIVVDFSGHREKVPMRNNSRRR